MFGIESFTRRYSQYSILKRPFPIKRYIYGARTREAYHRPIIGHTYNRLLVTYFLIDFFTTECLQPTVGGPCTLALNLLNFSFSFQKQIGRQLIECQMIIYGPTYEGRVTSVRIIMSFFSDKKSTTVCLTSATTAIRVRIRGKNKKFPTPY